MTPEPSHPPDEPVAPRAPRLEALLARAAAAPAADDLLDLALELLGGERALLLREGPGERLEPLRRRGTAAPEDEAAFSRTAARRALAAGRPLRLRAGLDPGLRGRASVRRLRLQAVLAAPLRLPDGARGVLYVDDRRRSALREGAEALVAAGLLAAALAATLRADGEPAAASATPSPPAAEPRAFPELVGRSPALLHLKGLLGRACASSEPALIQGESGTGKELVARCLHRGGPRARSGFVAVNCAAVPEPLLEAELFGWRRGAWTGADADREGLIALAHRGTLLLDEVGDMPLAMQAKLLRVLEEGEVRPLGAPRPRRVDVRVVAATHHDLAAAVAAGRFRADLFYRLAVLTLEVPPLRARRGDIPLLARHLLAEDEEPGAAPRDLTEGALQRLAAHAWPGNVRELRNALRRACVLACGPRLTRRDFAFLTGGAAALSDASDPPELSLEAAVRRQIRRALTEAGGDVRAAARLLEIHPATLYRRLKRDGL